jgi:molybdopterin-synthase adenylyltransferase
MQKRYQRQIMIESIGAEGQAKLAASRVLVVGAGGLGSPVLYYLCAAGIGGLGIVDPDRVSISNLNRQILHTEADLHERKTTSAAQKLRALNSQVMVREYAEMLSENNIRDIFLGYGVVVDCVDNLATRLLVARACHSLGIALVEGGINGFSGFVMSVKPGSACFGCLLNGTLIKDKMVPALGAAAGVAGSLQAAESIKLLLGIGEPLLNQVLFFDLLAQNFTRVKLTPSPACPVCGQSGV